MPTMIRKQIYIGRRHELLLKRLARQRRVSEAELIREAIDRQVEGGALVASPRDPGAWEEARRFMGRLARRRSAKPRRFRREDAYRDRLDRWR